MHIIKTNRLSLIPYCNDDINNVKILLGSEDVWKYSTRETNSSFEEAKNYLEAILKKYESKINAILALHKNDGTYIGEMGIYSENVSANRVNFGYNILPEFWGMGYATEIASEYIKLLFASDNINRIEATVLSDNEKSIRVLNKLEFKCEGTLREYVMIKEKYHDLVYYSILKNEKNYS